jgi:hypothetical protein
MQLINWLALQPLLADVDSLNARLQESQPIRRVCQSLAEITLGGFPWSGRLDLVPCYHPSKSYKPGQWIALPYPDPKMVHPTAWQVAQVKQAETTGNSAQGRFQALTLDVSGKEIRRTAGLTGATYLEPALAAYTSYEFDWLVDWVADTYNGALLATLRKLIQKGRIFGQIVGETFLPEQMFALSVERLDPFFARLSPALCWVSIEEILQGLPDLSHLKRETAMSLLRSTLKVSPYCSLGGDRWTTKEFFAQMDRDVPHGLPAPHVRSAHFGWTEQDKKDLAGTRLKSIPAEAKRALEKLGLGEDKSEPASSPWQPPRGPISLPPLSYLHITQACFPVANILHAFSPDARMVFVQFMDGDHQPFLLDRVRGLLKAVKPEALQAQIEEESLPAGTHLWLACQGEEMYRITPRPLLSPRLVPCKKISRLAGKLHIEQSEIEMKYECEASLFQAKMPCEEIEALSTGAKKKNLSLRDALISAIQELCAADPRKVASRADIFNTVFLQRPYSPHSVAVLLYTLPYFDHVEGDHFRYMQTTPVMNIWKGTNRVSQLWEDLAANCVDPNPAVTEKTSSWFDWDAAQQLSVEMVPDTTLTTSPDRQEMGVLEASSTISFLGASEDDRKENLTLLEKFGHESIHLIKHTIEVLTAPPEVERDAIQDREDSRDVSADNPEELDQIPVSAIVLEPGPAFYPTMVRVSMEPEQQASSIDTRRMAYGLKIPVRPLHKRPFYQRIFFCLRGWAHLASGRGYEHSTR